MGSELLNLIKGVIDKYVLAAWKIKGFMENKIR